MWMLAFSQALSSSQFAICRLKLSVEARSLDPELLSGHAIAAKLYHDSPDLSDAQPVLESTLDLVGQGPDTSNRMAGSPADWHTGAAKVLVLCCAALCHLTPSHAIPMACYAKPCYAMQCHTVFACVMMIYPGLRNSHQKASCWHGFQR